MTNSHFFQRTSMRAGLVLAVLAPTVATANDDEWNVTLGAGVVSLPEYPGSDERRTRAIPIVSATYGRWFIGGVPGSGGPAGAGAYLYRSENFQIGAALSGDAIRPRKESDDPRLRGLGDIDSTVRAGFFASWTAGWFTLSGNVFSDVGGKDHGTQASLDAQARWSAGDRLTFSAGPGITWSNSRHARTFYGVDAVQAAASGHTRYTPDGGVDEVRFSLGANYRLSERWNVGANVVASRLEGDVADSPVVVDESQNVFVAHATYHF